MATKDQFDVIILDSRLPDINGIDVLRHLRKLHEKTGNYIPIIMITGEGSEEIAIESMHSGAFDYIVKSVNYYSLIPQVLNDLEQNYTSNFEMDDIHVIVFKKGRFGPEVYLSTSLPFKNDPAQILPKVAVSYFFLTGAGESYNVGLFGPVPVGDELDYVALIYADFITDESIDDSRMGGKNYILTCIIYPKKFESFFTARREDIEHIYHEFLESFSDIKYITQDSLVDLQKRFYSPFILRKLEIELYNRNRILKKINIQNVDFSVGLSNKIIAISQKIQDNLGNPDSCANLLNYLSLIGKDAKLFVLLANKNLEIHFSQVNISDLLNNLLQEYKDIFVKKDLHINTSINDTILIECDQELLTLGIERILGDAIGSSTGSIEIIEKLENIQNLRLEFKYDKQNFNREPLNNLFEPFKENQELPSNGLGLAMCKAVIEAHNGKMWTENVTQSIVKILINLPLSKLT